MTRGYCDPETFCANRDRGVIDRLNVYVVIGEQLVRSGFGKSGVADENRDDVRRTRAVGGMISIRK